MKIAIIGTGIAGNVVAHHLHPHHDIEIFEASGHVGGHAHTHNIRRGNGTYAVDTGFIVFNERTYPNFTALLKQLGVATQPTRMSFSVRDERSGLEYNGTNLNTLFAQRRNLLRPGFLGMIRDILRFNKEAPLLLNRDGEGLCANDLTLEEYLAGNRYGRAFIEQYIVPMGSAIWSANASEILRFPASFFIRFFHNHGMLSIDDRPQWRTIAGGSANYVKALTAPFRKRIHLRTPVLGIVRMPGCVMLKTQGTEAARFDAVFVACHSDDALKLLADPTPAEKDILGAIPYRENAAVLHTDPRLLPRRKLARAAWNYHLHDNAGGQVALTYDMNVLQALKSPEPFLVTLNRTADIEASKVIQRITYRHPLFTQAAVAVQKRQAEINGPLNTYFCGAYWRNGFHEDGVASALTALSHFHEYSSHAQRTLRRPG
ncbi:MAG: NAD(P)/FAD-dependent oxidoreductase [Burkholderiales bacterium]